MSTVTEIIARLKAIDPPVFSLVEGIGAYAALGDARPPAVPAAYVYVKGDASGGNERMGSGVLQRMESDIGVLIATENVSDEAAGAAAADIEALKEKTRGALIGFLPAASQAAGEPLTHVSGELIKTRGGTVWFEDVYAAATYLTQA